MGYRYTEARPAAVASAAQGRPPTDAPAARATAGKAATMWLGLAFGSACVYAGRSSLLHHSDGSAGEAVQHQASMKIFFDPFDAPVDPPHPLGPARYADFTDDGASAEVGLTTDGKKWSLMYGGDPVDGPKFQACDYYKERVAKGLPPPSVVGTDKMSRRTSVHFREQFSDLHQFWSDPNKPYQIKGEVRPHGV